MSATSVADDEGSYILPFVFIFPVLFLVFLAITQLGIREFERMVLAKALTQATFTAVAQRDPGIVEEQVRTHLQTAWGAGGAPGMWDSDAVYVTAAWKPAGDGNLILHADLAYTVPAVLPLPDNGTWLSNRIRLSSEQYADF